MFILRRIFLGLLNLGSLQIQLGCCPSMFQTEWRFHAKYKRLCSINQSTEWYPITSEAARAMASFPFAISPPFRRNHWLPYREDLRTNIGACAQMCLDALGIDLRRTVCHVLIAGQTVTPWNSGDNIHSSLLYRSSPTGPIIVAPSGTWTCYCPRQFRETK